MIPADVYALTLDEAREQLRRAWELGLSAERVAGLEEYVRRYGDATDEEDDEP